MPTFRIWASMYGRTKVAAFCAEGIEQFPEPSSGKGLTKRDWTEALGLFGSRDNQSRNANVLSVP
jgi:hypothetical protein